MAQLKAGRRELIIELFKEGCSLGAIRRNTGHTPDCARKVLNAAGLIDGYAPLHREGYRVRHCAINEHAFDDASPERDYWVGMMMTDGCVADSYVILGLQRRDAGHVEAFRSFLRSTHRLTENGRMVNLAISSHHMQRTLAGFGVVPRKTRIAKVIGLEGSRDFWRGCVDGDGSVCLARNEHFGDDVYPVISLCGASPDLLDQFREYVRHIVTTADIARRKVDPRCGVGTVSLKGQNAIAMIRHLYEGATIALQRKAETAAAILSRAAVDPTWCVHPRRGSPGKRTPEQCERISASKRGIKQTVEHIANRTRGILNSDRFKDAARRRGQRVHHERMSELRQHTASILQWHAQGCGVVVIAGKLHCQPEKISMILRENGVVVRSGVRPHKT